MDQVVAFLSYLDLNVKHSYFTFWQSVKMAVQPDLASSSSIGAAWPRGYKTFIMLNSAEHEILIISLKKKYKKKNQLLAF